MRQHASWRSAAVQAKQLQRNDVPSRLRLPRQALNRLEIHVRSQSLLNATQTCAAINPKYNLRLPSMLCGII